jgi:FAD/FMN-containing dehydrogenase
MVLKLDGAIFMRGDDGYEDARQAAVWNLRKPERYPEAIVLAASEQDVVEAVRFAKREGLQVKARSGGHSWTGSSVRDGSVLINLSGLQEIAFDPATQITRVSPGVKGRDLNALLGQHDLFFPSGHCPSVGLGGFLLQGGWGWLGRKLGPSCLNVVAVDLVNADGELIHASESENSDYLWAARGSGAGFFGVVTRFHVRPHPRPRAIYEEVCVYPLEVLDELLHWAMEVEERFPPELEFAILGTTPRQPDGTVVEGETALVIMASAMMDSDEEARAALALLDTCPVLARRLAGEGPVKKRFSDLYDGPDSVEPEGFRWSADGMWTDHGPADVVPAVRELFTSVPSPASHVFWYPWRPNPLPDTAAISVQGKLYIAAFSGWHDPAEDERFLAWPVDQMRRLEPLSKGIQLADENLIGRPARYLSDENNARLEALRAEHDPEQLFCSYLTA